MIKSIICECSFKVVQDKLSFQTKRVRAGVPQWSVLGPTLYSLYTHDMPSADYMSLSDPNDLLVATFADDTAVLARDTCVYTATDMLQLYLNKFEIWAFLWIISVNPEKCVSVTYTNWTPTNTSVSLWIKFLRFNTM